MLVFIDVDGTLVTGMDEVSPGDARAVSRLRGAGHQPFLCTGRGGRSITARIWALGFSGMVGLTGARVTVGEEVIHESVLPRAITRRMVELFLARDAAATLESEIWCCAVGGRDHALATANDQVFCNGQVRSLVEWDKQWAGETFHKASISRAAWERLGADRSFFEEHFLAHGVGSQEMELVPKGNSKGEGIRRVLEYLGQSPDNAMGIGDSDNDISMLQSVGVGVAMGSAPDSLKALAGFVTLPVEQEGVRHALEKYGLVPAGA